MSELTQLKSSSTTHTATKKKHDKESQHSSLLATNEHQHSGTAPAELLNETAEGIFDAPTNSGLGAASSTFSSQSGRSQGGTFAGKSFAGVPTRASGQASIQTKLTVGAAHDPYEEEADQIAEQVMRSPAATFTAPSSGGDSGNNKPSVQRSPDEEEEIQTKPLASLITPRLQRAAPVLEEEEIQRETTDEEELQTRRTSAADSFEVGDDFENRVAATRGGGSPLPAETRSFMEPRFGADFSSVRLHAGTESAELNRTVSAQAFTLGSDIYLGPGKTDVTSDAGKQLLAHELTHVVQQGGVNQVQRAWQEEDDRVQVNVESASSNNGAQAVETAAAGRSTDQLGGADKPRESLTASDAAPTDQLTQPRQLSEQTAPEEKPVSAPAQATQVTSPPAASSETPAAATAKPRAADGKMSAAAEEDLAAKPAPPAVDQSQQPEQQTAPTATVEDQLADRQVQKPATAQDKHPTQPAEKPAAEQDKKPTEQAEAIGQAVTEAATAAVEDPTQAEITPETAVDQAPQVTADIIEETQTQAAEAQTQRAESDQLVQQTTAELDSLNGADAIMPESLWQEMQLDQRTDLNEPQPEQAVSSPVTEQTDAILQRSPDPTLQRQPADPPQAAPQQIKIPTITVDTALISAAAANAIANVDFGGKLTELQTAVTTAKERVNQRGTTALTQLETQLTTTLEKLETDAQKAKDDITTKYDTANQALDQIQQTIPTRVNAIIQAGCQKIDAAVAEYVNKCEPVATAAIQPYCTKQRATLDNDKSPLLGGPGEEKGYHGKKADAALKAALDVGRAYAAEYKKQGDDTKGVFQGQVRTDLTQTMQNEITGMRTALTDARDSAWTEIDNTKTQLIQQANDLYTQSVDTLNNAMSATLSDLTNYQAQLSAEFTSTQSGFGTQIQSQSNTAIAQAQAALAAAQAALAAAIRSATGPDKLLKPGAQAAIDQAAAQIQAQLNQQVSDAAAQITGQGAQMNATVAGLDVQGGSNAYAETFETTTNSMLDQVITNGLVVINTNLVDFGTQLTTQSETTFNSYVTAATGSLQQIDDASQTNLPQFVDSQFKPGLAQAHQKLAAQAAREGEKAGEAVQPSWKAWAKAFVSIVIAVVVAVAIVAIVAATGGVAGILLGVLAGAAIGAAGGAIKCIANNAIDGKQGGELFTGIGQEMVTGAISGALSGLTAGALGVAFQGTLTAGQIVIKESIEAVAGGLKDGIVEIVAQSSKYGWSNIDWGSVGMKALESFVINAVTAGIFKTPGILKATREADTGLVAGATQIKAGLEETADDVIGGGVRGTKLNIDADSGLATPGSTTFKGVDFEPNSNGLLVPKGGTKFDGVDFEPNSSGLLVPGGTKFNGVDYKPGPGGVLLPSGTKFNGVDFETSPSGLFLPKGNTTFDGIDFKTTPSGLSVPSNVRIPVNPWQNVNNALANPNWSQMKPSQWNMTEFWKKTATANPFVNPFKDASAWGNASWFKATTKEGLKQGQNALAGQDWWTSSKEMSTNSHKKGPAPTGAIDYSGLTPSANGSLPGYNWNVPIPNAPSYDPRLWNFQNQQAIPQLPTPDEIAQFNFGVDVNEDELNESVSTRKP